MPVGGPVLHLHLACRLHSTLKGTPAMRAGIAGHPWTLAELLANAGV